MIRLNFIPSFMLTGIGAVERGISKEAIQVKVATRGNFKRRVVVPCQCDRLPVWDGNPPLRDRKIARVVMEAMLFKMQGERYVLYYGKCQCGRHYFDCYSAPIDELINR